MHSQRRGGDRTTVQFCEEAIRAARASGDGAHFFDEWRQLRRLAAPALNRLQSTSRRCAVAVRVALRRTRRWPSPRRARAAARGPDQRSGISSRRNQERNAEDAALGPRQHPRNRAAAPLQRPQQRRRHAAVENHHKTARGAEQADRDQHANHDRPFQRPENHA